MPRPAHRPVARTVSTEAFFAAFLQWFPDAYAKRLAREAPLSQVASALTAQAVSAALASASRPAADAPGAPMPAIDNERLVLRRVYGRAEPRLRFASLSGLTKTGQALVAALKRAGRHLLDPKRYGIAAIEALAAAQARRARESNGVLAAPSLAERSRSLPLWAAIEKLGPTGRARQDARPLLFARLLELSESPVPSVARQFAVARKVQRRQLASALRLELAVARAVVR